METTANQTLATQPIRIPTAVLVGIIAFVYFLLACLAEMHILTEEFYYRYLGGGQNLDEVVRKTKNFSTVKVFFITLIPLLNILFVYFCLNTGLMTTDLKYTSSDILRVIATGYFVFIIPVFIRFAYFLSLSGDFTLGEYTDFVFGSGLFLYDPSFSHYAVKAVLETFTLFEFLYWGLLAYGLKKITGWDYSKNLSFVAMSYGLGLVLMVALKVYFVIVFFK